MNQQKRPYPEGIAFDEAWRQRQRADAAVAHRDELLEALEMTRTQIEYLVDLWGSEAITQRVIDAIAKATGETE